MPFQSRTQLNDSVALLSECIKTKNLKLGRQLHSLLIKTAFTHNTFITNRLIDMYSKCDSIDCAEMAFHDLPVKNSRSWNTIVSSHARVGRFSTVFKLFAEIPEPNMVSYNSLLSSLTRHGLYRDSIDIFKRMQIVGARNGLWLDEFTIVSLVNTAAGLGSVKLLSQLHGIAILTHLDCNVVVCNSLINAFGKCNKPTHSFKVFSQMKSRDVVSWTSMLVAYAHAGRLLDACWVFDHMPERNVVSWTALLEGFAKNGQVDKALSLFAEMEAAHVVPGAFTYVSVLSACADLALVEIGKQIHGRMYKSASVNDLQNVFVINALVHFYCKCGDMKSAMKLFERFHDKDIVTWNSMIAGFAQNGQAELSIELFKCMTEEKVKPNNLTFLAVLSGCNHAGSVSEGFRVLATMEDFGEIPMLDHYAILIDLLGRKNLLEEAFQLVEKVPDGSDHIGMWGAMLNACRIHGNVELGKRAAEGLFKLEPDNSGRYVMLSNIYNAAGWWDDAFKVRKLMDEKTLRKEVACSRIEVRNKRHEFVSKDRNHIQVQQVKEVLDMLPAHMMDIGYTSLLENIVHDEEK